MIYLKQKNQYNNLNHSARVITLAELKTFPPLKEITMKLTIKYFGLLAEITQCNEEQFEFFGTDVSALKEALYTKYILLNGKDFQVAQGQVLVNNDTLINEKEIALLPPFAGG